MGDEVVVEVPAEGQSRRWSRRGGSLAQLSCGGSSENGESRGRGKRRPLLRLSVEEGRYVAHERIEEHSSRA